MTVRRARLRGWLLRWHRRIGLGVVLLVLMVTVTGLLIQLAHPLGWDRAAVRTGWLKSLYGIVTDPVTEGFYVGGHWYTRVGDELFRDDNAMSACTAPLHAVFQQDTDLLVLCGDSLSLFSGAGILLEQLPAPAVPEQVGVSEGMLTMQAGEKRWRWVTDTAEWEPLTLPAMPYRPQPLPQPLAESLSAAVPLPHITRERVLLDLHAGRLFGRIGEWLVTLSGLGLLWLSVTGAMAWWKRTGRS